MIRTQFSTFGDMLRDVSSHYPQAPAILAPGRLPLTYAQFYTHVTDTCHVLNALGIGRNHRVAVVSPSSAETGTAIIAVESAATCVTFNPADSLASLTTILKRLKVETVIIAEGTQTAAWDSARQLRLPILTLIPLPEREAGIFRLSGTTGLAPIAPDSDAGGFAQAEDIAHFILTSGTTAESRIVAVKQRQAATHALLMDEAIDLNEQDRLLHFMPMYHSTGYGALLQSLVVGGATYILPGFEGKTFFRSLDEFRPTWFAAVTPMYQAILDQAAQYEDVLARSCLRYSVAMSMALDAERTTTLERLLRAPIVQVYGASEVGQVTSTPLPPRPRKPGSAGLLMRGTQVMTLDSEGRFLPQGETGEIVVRGPMVMSGYEDDPEGTAQAFIDGWYRTGDLGYFDSDGYLFVVGRVKEVINRGGQKVSPGEVEQALLAHPQVAQAAAFALPDPRLGDEVAAAVILRTPGSMTEAALRDFVATMLAPYKVPRRIVFVDTLPRNAIGKVQRLGLAQTLGLMLTTLPVSGDFVPPHTEIEQQLARIWVEVLGCDSALVGAHTRFADLGGVSLSAAHLIFKVRETFGVPVTILDLFDAATISEQAIIVEKLRHDPISRPGGNYLIPIQPNGMRPPLYCFHALEGGVYFYRELIPYLNPDQPVYGLLAVGMDDGREPYRTIEEMAQHHYQQIKAVQLRGPYYLCGYSFGGRLALETARLLREEGNADTYVLLIDDLLQTNAWYRYPDRKRQTLLDRLESLRFGLLELAPPHRALYVRQRVKHYWQRRKQQGIRDDRRSTLPSTAQQVANAAEEAGKRYVPRPYEGQICYLFAIDNEINIPLFKTLKHIGLGNMVIRNIPGNHHNLFLPPYVEAVGREVQRWLDER